METKKTYGEKLEDPRWQKKRLDIFKRDEWKCRLCKDDKLTLHLHHDKYEPGKEPWEVDDEFLRTLCKYCHSFVESLKGEPALIPISILKFLTDHKNMCVMVVKFLGKDDKFIFYAKENMDDWRVFVCFPNQLFKEMYEF